ncbi:hypothetical protein D3C81_1563990 [compost metagenome]
MPRLSRSRPFGAISPVTSTTYSCSSLAASSFSLRRVRQSWVSTSRPLALGCRGRVVVRRAKWLRSGRTSARSSGQRLPSVSNCWAASKLRPAGWFSSRVIGSSGSGVAPGSSATTWPSTLNWGCSMTSPSTVTQPPSIYSSASRREQPVSSITRLDKRMGSVMGAVAMGERAQW